MKPDVALGMGVSDAYIEPRRSERIWKVLWQVFAYIVVTIGGVIMIAPFLWMASTAFKSGGSAFDYPPTWIPQPFTFENFKEVWTVVDFSRYFLNSMFIAVCVTAGEVLTSALAAYSFARLRFPGRDALFLMYLATLMIPGQVTIIPNFILMRYLGWINTYEGLIIPTAFTAFGTFLLRQYFLSIPRELEEAARVDGAGYFQIWWRIILPLATPAIATLGVFSFMGAWNSFLWPFIMVSTSDMRTLTVALRSLQTEYGTEWGMMMAGSLIAMLPMLIIFLAAQRYFVRGIATSGFGGR